jgi:hypothetical protein
LLGVYLLRGGTDAFHRVQYRSSSLPGRTELGYWIANYSPIQSRAGRVEQAGALRIEVMEQRELEERFRRLGNELPWKKEEYQRLSRELHESIKGYHAALGMRLDRLSRCTSNPERIPELLGAVHGIHRPAQRRLESTVARCFPIDQRH